MRAWLRKVLTLGGTPRGIAGGFALGVGLSLVPIPVLGMVVALALAPVLQLNPPATYLGTAVVNPVTGAFIYFGELWLGMTLLGRDAPRWSVLRSLDAAGWWELFTGMLGPFALGAAVCIAGGATLSYAVVFIGARSYQRARQAGRERKRANAEASALPSDEA